MLWHIKRALLTIGNKDYLIVIGSQNEPVFVDDKSGVDLFAYTPDPKDPMNSFANGTKPIEAIEKTLKVELSAGDKKKVLQLEPAFRVQDTTMRHFILQYRQHTTIVCLEPLTIHHKSYIHMQSWKRTRK